MRIAHVPTPLAPANSSIIDVVRNLCAAHVATSGADEPPIVVVADSRDIAFEHARFVRVDYRRYCPREWFSKHEVRADHLCGFLGLTRPYSARLYLPAVEAMSREKPAAIVIHEGHHGTPSLRYWRRLRPDSLIVLWVHIPLSRGYGRRELRRLLGYADGIIFPSEDLQQKVLRRAGRLATPTAVIHNGFAPSIFHSEGRRESETFRVSYVGEVVEFKGVHLWLQAMSRFSALSPRPLQLTIVGSNRWLTSGEISSYESSLRDFARAHDLEVRWISRVPQRELGQIYRETDVLCVPSVCDEAFGMVVVEALACGCAVVASPRGGLLEAGGESAIYVDPEDEVELAEAIARLANDPGHLDERRRSGAARVAGHSWSEAYDRFRQALEDFRAAGDRA
jgi:glycosyltransferase involved in cell wall biosynthesis